MPVRDHTGARFNNLLVIDRVVKVGRREAHWRCRCVCGSETVVSGSYLRNGVVVSCGCKRADLARERFRTHGKTNTSEYRVWSTMNRRCHSERSTRYAQYGARGVTVCPSWRGRGGFERFLAEVGERPSPCHSIDRIDVTRGYEPGNVRWATTLQQANNRTDNVYVEAHGVRLSVAEWSRRSGLNPSTISRRLAAGFSPEYAVSRPSKKAPKIGVQGP